MPKYTFKEIKNRFGGYWRYDILNFYYLANSYFPSEAMLEELKEKLSQLAKNYPSTQRKIAELMAQWKDKPYFTVENLIVGNGSSELIKALNSLVTKITIPIPCFNEFVQLPEEKMHIIETKAENSFQPKADELIEQIKQSNSQWTVINNPGNPSGGLMAREEIEKILQTGVITIVDEAYIDFSPGYSVEDLVLKYNNLVIVKSLTKAAGAAGLRVAYLLTTNQEIKEGVKKYLPIWNINAIAECFIELFPKHQAVFRESIKKTIEDRDYLFEKLKEIPYLTPLLSGGNFVFCKTSKGAQELAEKLLEEHNIFIKPGLHQLSLQSDQYLRIGARPKEDIDKIIKCLKTLE